MNPEWILIRQAKLGIALSEYIYRGEKQLKLAGWRQSGGSGIHIIIRKDTEFVSK